nr:MAG TPA: hypothetical protein [Caudoviricetes sp.]
MFGYYFCDLLFTNVNSCDIINNVNRKTNR